MDTEIIIKLFSPVFVLWKKIVRFQSNIVRSVERRKGGMGQRREKEERKEREGEGRGEIERERGSGERGQKKTICYNLLFKRKDNWR